MKKAQLEIYEPLYSSKFQYLSESFTEKLKDALKSSFGMDSLEWNIVPTFQQQDSTSCGPISAENGKHFLGGSINGNSLLQASYTSGANELRTQHIEEIGKSFAEIQYANNRLKSSDDPMNIDKISKIESRRYNLVAELFKKWMQRSIHKWQDIIKETFLCLLKEEMTRDDFSRESYKKLKEFLLSNKQLLVNEKIDEQANLFNYFLNEKDNWQDSAIDTLQLITRSFEKSDKEKLSQKESPIDLYEKRSSLTKAFPGPLYQCLVALHHVLLLAAKPEMDFSIRMEDAHAGAFDDIIIQTNGRTEYIQIKHKYSEDSNDKSKKEDKLANQYNSGDFTSKTGAVELHKYFDDWYVFIESKGHDKEQKDFTFHSNGRLDPHVEKYFLFDKTKQLYNLKFTDQEWVKKYSIKIVKESPAAEKIELNNRIYIYPDKDKWKFAFRRSSEKRDVVRKEILISQLEPALIEKLRNFSKLESKEENKILELFYLGLFITPIIQKIKQYSVICNKELFNQYIASKNDNDEMLIEDEGRLETKSTQKPVSQAAVIELKKNKSVWPILINKKLQENIEKFLKSFKFKFTNEHISKLEETVKGQVSQFIKEKVSSDNVYHPLIIEVHKWLCDMKTIPWTKDFILAKLESFKNRYIELLHKIGESQLSFR